MHCKNTVFGHNKVTVHITTITRNERRCNVGLCVRDGVTPFLTKVTKLTALFTVKVTSLTATSNATFYMAGGCLPVAQGAAKQPPKTAVVITEKVASQLTTATARECSELL